MEERFETFTVLIASIARNIKKIKSEEMEEFSLKGPHVSCLYYLYKQGKLTAKELCSICDEDKANISRSIEFLENNGYLVCASSMAKRYNSYLMLSQKGEEVGKQIALKIDKLLDEASVGLSEENRKIMYESLKIVHDNLNKICSKYEVK